MTNLRKYIPEGTRDILFNECTVKKNIENILRSIYIEMGYKEVNTPTFEFYDVYNLRNQPITQDKMYKLFDNLGRMLVLRPDMTTPIARIAATKIKERNSPVKLSYTGSIYRMNEVLNGKMSEITQSGIEILGSDSLRADVEVIITAIRGLLKSGLKKFKIEIGQVDFFKSIIEEVNIDEEEAEKLRNLIENKNLSEVEYFIEENKSLIGNKKELIKSIPELFGGREVIERAQKLTSNEKAIKALETVLKVYAAVEKAGYGEYLSIDLGMVQHINYYTGLIYRGYARGVGDALLSGGRYDTLISQFGSDIKATGLAINVDNLMEALTSEGNFISSETSSCVIFSTAIENAYKKFFELSRKGIKSEISLFNNMSETIAYCKENNIPKVIDGDTGKTIKVGE